jgi:hypothetical protein
MQTQAKHWQEFRDIVRDRWGNITDQEFEENGQDLARLTKLISHKYHTPVAEVYRELKAMVLRMRQGHPMLFDHFAGLGHLAEEYPEAVLIDSKDPASQEWHAREDVQKKVEKRENL